MSVFQVGSSGINMLSNFFTSGSISSQTVSSSEIDTYYTTGVKSVLYGSYSVNSGGTTISGGTVTGWSVFNADGSLYWSINGFSADVQTIALDYSLGLNNEVTAMILPANSTYHGSANPNASDVLTGFGGDTFIGGAATEVFIPASGTNTITGGTGANTVQFGGTFSSYTIVNAGGMAVTVTDSFITRNGIDHISGVQTLKFTDVSATVLANGEVSLPAASVYQASLWANASDVAPVAVSDSSTNVLNGITGLESLATAGKLGSITLTDNGTGEVTLNLTAAQVTADAAALKLISNAIIDVSASSANISFVGTGDPATVVVFSGKESQYQITPTGGGGVTVTDTGTGRTSSDHFANITELQFSDQSVFVATTPASDGSATTGNVTELYAAAFGREPDPAGLAYYQQELTANPSLALTSFAQKFLASPEYTNNSAHNYAQTTAGETKFISDLFTNLLHRSPDASATPFYLNLITKLTSQDAAGTQAYTADDAYAHAVVLTDISQSAEFLGNVQLTGQSTNGSTGTTGTTGTHWLLVS